MEEFDKIIKIDLALAHLKTEAKALQESIAPQIEDLHAQIEALQCSIAPQIEDLANQESRLLTEKKEALSVATSIMGDQKKITINGWKWKQTFGRLSVKPLQDIDLDSVPDEFVQIKKEISKSSLMAAYKKDPASIAPYAEVVMGEPKLTYEMDK